MKKYPQTRKENLVLQESGDELLIYDLEANKAYCLNPSAAIVWKSCDGERSVSEIRTKVSKELGASVSSDLILLSLEQLNTEGLVLGRPDGLSDFEGLSRREIVRRIGATSLVALPIVASVVAPTSVSAQSLAPPGSLPINSPCTANSECVIGNPNMTGTPFAGCCGEDRPMGGNNGVCRPQNFNVDAGGGCIGDGFGSS